MHLSLLEDVLGRIRYMSEAILEKRHQCNALKAQIHRKSNALSIYLGLYDLLLANKIVFGFLELSVRFFTTQCHTIIFLSISSPFENVPFSSWGTILDGFM